MKLPAEPHRRALWLYHITVLCLFLAAIAYYLAVRLANLRYPCLFTWITHLYCPGCGCTRALGALLRLDFFTSLSYNPTVPLAAALFIHYEVAFLRAARRRAGKVSPVPLYIGCAVFVGYAVLRNILLVRFGIDPLGDLLIFWS